MYLLTCMGYIYIIREVHNWVSVCLLEIIHCGPWLALMTQITGRIFKVLSLHKYRIKFKKTWSHISSFGSVLCCGIFWECPCPALLINVANGLVTNSSVKPSFTPTLFQFQLMTLWIDLSGPSGRINVICLPWTS